MHTRLPTCSSAEAPGLVPAGGISICGRSTPARAAMGLYRGRARMLALAAAALVVGVGYVEVRLDLGYVWVGVPGPGGCS